MPDNNYNYGPSYIMNSDKTSYDAADAPLTREGKDFDTTMGNYDLQSDMPKNSLNQLLKLLSTQWLTIKTTSK